MNNRSIVLCAPVSGPFVNSAFEVGGQTIRKTGRAETLDHAEEAPMCSRVPSESRIYTWTGNRYFGSSKRVAPAIAPCCCRRILPFASLHACVRIIADRLVIHNNLSSRCRSSCGALRPAEVVFRSLRYTVSPADL
jgi:hypothetical protein